MTKMINGYKNSCLLVKERLEELKKQLRMLEKDGNSAEIESLDLERRIALLYTEYRQMKEIIEHLTNHMRRVEQRVKTEKIL